ncbi:unnamed protein product [Sphagnum jensenii]|uniref:Uncharacterized protein n=1 Tax=Sphagnum jensenii TaxID=128206 RepID=A0ABP1AKG7_9BRYO
MVWSFFATGHGKGGVDGAGDLLKREDVNWPPVLVAAARSALGQQSRSSLIDRDTVVRIGALYGNFGTEKAVEHKWNVPTQYNCKESLMGIVSMMVVMDLSPTSTTDGHTQHNRAWSLHWPFQKHLSVIFSRLMGWKANYFYSSCPSYQLIQLRALGSIQEQPCRSHLQGAAYIGHVLGLTVGAQHQFLLLQHCS